MISRAVLRVSLAGVLLVAGCAGTDNRAPGPGPLVPNAVITELFTAYEARDHNRFRAAVNPDFRSADASGRALDYGRFLEAATADFDNLHLLHYQVAVLAAMPVSEEVVRVQIRWRLRAQARVTGEEWLTAERLGVLLFRGNRLAGMEGDAPFALADERGIISLRNGQVDGLSVGPAARIGQGRYAP